MQMSSAMVPTPLTNTTTTTTTTTINSNPPSSSSMRSPPAPLSLNFLSLPPSSSTPPHPSHHHHRPSQPSQPFLNHYNHNHHPSRHHVIEPEPIAALHPSGDPAAVVPLARVRLSDITPYDGAPGGIYFKSVEALSGSLMRHNAVVIELGNEDAALMRCALEATRLYFRTRAQSSNGGGNWGKPSRGVYMYRAGRPFEDGDSSPPCMADAFRCMGKAARAALCAIARHLRLRSDGAFLEDAVAVSCGHSFGGLMLRKVIEMENGEMIGDGESPHRGVQYPFSVDEKVVIKGNRRTPEKFVGREAVITSQCLNGWYLLKILGTGESVRLQYRSLRKILTSQASEDRHQSQSIVQATS